MFSVLMGGVVAWAAAVLLRDVDVFAGWSAGAAGEEWELFSDELDTSLLQVGADARSV